MTEQHSSSFVQPVRKLAAGIVFGIAAAAVALSPAPGGNAFAQGAPASFADLAERLSPAVVNISTAQTVTRPNRPFPNLPEGSPFEDFFRDFFDRRGGGGGGGGRGDGEGRPRSVQSLGSGFVIDPSGFVVTNNHVIESADEIEVNFVDGTSLEATLIGRDPKTDIALLKVESDEPLPFVPFGDSDAARVGDWVMAIGNPFGLGGSVSAGIISARNRDINAGPYDDFLQTDAAINRGNSGGPLFNMGGEVIGVNTAIISPSGGSIGIGFSVPANIAESVVEQLREFGRTRRGWLGVRIQPVDETLADSLGLDSARGALVANVDENGPAFAAGIEAGDVITRFNGRPIEQMRDLPRIVAETPVGSVVPVEVFRKRGFEEFSVDIALLKEEVDEEPRPASAELSEPDSGFEALGITFEPLTRALRERFNITGGVNGVAVTAVEETSSAYERGVRPGDVVVQVSQNDVSTPSDVERELDAARADGRRSVLLMVNRTGELRFIAVEFEE